MRRGRRQVAQAAGEGSRRAAAQPTKLALPCSAQPTFNPPHPRRLVLARPQPLLDLRNAGGQVLLSRHLACGHEWQVQQGDTERRALSVDAIGACSCCAEDACAAGRDSAHGPPAARCASSSPGSTRQRCRQSCGDSRAAPKTSASRRARSTSALSAATWAGGEGRQRARRTFGMPSSSHVQTGSLLTERKVPNKGGSPHTKQNECSLQHAWRS